MSITIANNDRSRPSPSLATDGGQPLQTMVRGQRIYIYIFIIAVICVEASLFRIGERRINYPLVVAALLLLLPQTMQGLGMLKKFRVPNSILLPLFAYIAYCLISALWSPVRAETLFHGLILGLGMMTALSATRFKAEQTLTIFLTVSMAICVLSWVALFIAPTFALQQKGYWRLRGIMNHEFELGFLAAASLIILAVWWVSPNRPDATKFGAWHYALAGLAAATLFATQTRTTFVYVLAILLFLGLFYARGGKRLLVMAGALVCVLIGFYYLEDILGAFSRGEGDATLSGRTTIWARTTALADMVPWRGYGFGSFTDPMFDYVWYRYRPPHAHNTWIMAYFETGRIGATLLSLFMAAQLFVGFRLSQKMKRPSAGFFLALLATVSGMTSLIYGGKLAAMYCVPFMVLLQEYAAVYPRRKKSRNALPAKRW